MGSRSPARLAPVLRLSAKTLPSNVAIVWQKQLPAGTNSPLAINGNLLVTAASFPSGKQKAQIVAYRLPS
jgi:hypothetical protein